VIKLAAGTKKVCQIFSSFYLSMEQNRQWKTVSIGTHKYLCYPGLVVVYSASHQFKPIVKRTFLYLNFGVNQLPFTNINIKFLIGFLIAD
jgi:hypothetical protein